MRWCWCCSWCSSIVEFAFMSVIFAVLSRRWFDHCIFTAAKNGVKTRRNKQIRSERERHVNDSSTFPFNICGSEMHDNGRTNIRHLRISLYYTGRQTSLSTNVMFSTIKPSSDWFLHIKSHIHSHLAHTHTRTHSLTLSFTHTHSQRKMNITLFV